MFNFHNSNDFRPRRCVSNPILPDMPSIQPEVLDGVVRNKVVFVPVDHRSLYHGVVFDPAVMSLSAKLNMGVELRRVQFGSLENDPNKLQQVAGNMENAISRVYDELIAQQNSSDDVIPVNDSNPDNV